MTVALATKAVQRTLRAKKLVIACTLTADYATGGQAIDLTKIVPTLGQSDATVGYPGTITDYGIESLPAGYTGELIKGSNLTNWLLKIYTAPDTELPQAAYPASLLATPPRIFVEGPKLRI